MSTRNSCTPFVKLLTIFLGLGWFATPPLAAQGGDPPTITEHPASQDVCAGEAVTFSVTVSGTTPFEYQWRKDDQPIPGAINAEYVIASAALADAGNYDVEVTNEFGTAVSEAATLTVSAGPVIQAQPEDTTGCEGAAVTLSVVVVGGGTSAEANVVGSAANSGVGSRLRGNYYEVTSATTLMRIEQFLDITTPGPVTFFVYEADVSAGPYALLIERTLEEAPAGRAFVSSPALNQTLEVGKFYIIGAGWPDAHTYFWGGVHTQPTAFGRSTAGFLAAYRDPLPDPPPANTSPVVAYQRLTSSRVALAYQWHRNGVPLSGGTGPDYTIPALVPIDAGSYHVVITDFCDTTISDSAALTVETAATITEQPTPQSTCMGGGVAFTVVAAGTPAPTYQWRKEGKAIPGATASRLNIELATPDDAGDYDVLVSNACAEVSSNVAALTVPVRVPGITEHPAGLAACEGQVVTFVVVAEGDVLGYQWRHDGVEITDAIESTYTVDPVSAGGGGDYDVIVTNACGISTSLPATLAVHPPLTVTRDPFGGTLCTGDAITLSVEFTGTALAFQWRKDEIDIPGAESDTYTIDPAVIEDTGVYDVVIVDVCDIVVSGFTSVTVSEGPTIVEQPVDQHVEMGLPFTLAVDAVIDPVRTAVDTVGSDAQSATGPRIRGNFHAAEISTTLRRIEQFLDVRAPGPVHFFVYEAEAENGPYTLLELNTRQIANTGPRFYASDIIDVPITAGKFYLIGAAWPESNMYYWDDDPGQTTALGTVFSGYVSQYLEPLPPDPQPNSPNVYHQRLSTADTRMTWQWHLDGVVIPGATGAQFSISAATLADAGIYHVVVTNVCGPTASDAVRVRMVTSGGLEPQSGRLEPPPRPHP